MNDCRRWLKIASRGLRMLAVMALMITTVTSAAASPTAQESAAGGPWSLGISASTYSSREDAESYTNSELALGARFVVTSEDGDYIGECTLEARENPPGWHNCRVDVPSDRISLVWEDLDSIPAGYAPIENPITFDPTTYTTGPHNIGAWFGNYPVESAAQTSHQAEMESMSIMPQGPDGPVLGVGFTVTTQDGSFLGSCSVPLDFPQGYIPNCPVMVPVNSIVVIWFDPAVSSTTLVPVENPVYFDTGPRPAAQMWGPGFAFQPGGAGAASQSSGGAVNDAFSILPTVSDMPGGLVETGRQTRPLSEVVAYYTDPTETTQLFTQWGWTENSIASFSIPSNQRAQSGQVNGVYVSIHRFGSPDAARAALDFSLTEQAAGTSLREIDTRHFGGATRALFGTMDYGNETTLLTQQDGLLIRVSASMLDGDPTAAAESIMEGIIERATSTKTGATAAVGASQQTWSASVQVNLCDAPPNSGQAMNCRAGAGVVVNISLASGELVGSCTLGEPQPTPWGTTVSLCAVDGLPFNVDLVATQDPATIPSGYVPHVDTLTLQVGEQIPGGGDEATFTFFNIRTNTGSKNPAFAYFYS